MRGCLRVCLAPFVFGLVVIGLLAFTHPGRTAVATLLFLPQAFPQTGRTPIELVTDPPTLEEVSFISDGTEVPADLYRPAGGERHGALIFYLGIQPIERRDPMLTRLAEGLARIGLVVLVPELPALYSGRLDPEETAILIEAVEFLRRQPNVDLERIGMSGFSVGAGLMLLAAADPRIADQVDWVNSFGGYFDARALVRAVLAREIRLPDGTRRAWIPEDLTLAVLRRQLIEALPRQEDQVILLNVFFGSQPATSADLIGLSEAGRNLYRILTAQTPAQVDELLPLMPAEVAAAIESISPDHRIDQLRAHVFVMHDRDDSYIPFTHSRQLVAALPPEQVTYTEFSLFRHVEPSADLDALSFAWESVRLYGHLYRILLRAR